MNTLSEWFMLGQAWLHEHLFQPVLVAAGAYNLLDKGYEGAGWLLVGLLQILLMLLVIGPLQKRWPVQVWGADAQARRVAERAIRTDVIYTLIQRLGLFKLFMFFTLDALLEQFWGDLRGQGLATWHLDQMWPGVTDVAWVSFVLYLIVFDALHYGIHRAQHQSGRWWALHALHHSQRHMTMWTDNRNHLLDDVATSLIVSVVALLIGVGPGQFMVLVALSQLMENLQHANLNLSFGRFGDRLLISSQFHRLHHAIGIGHESRPGAVLGGHNFGVLFPWWDMLLGTACFERSTEGTGIRDQVEQGRDYGSGFWSQQWLGVKRLFGRG